VPGVRGVGLNWKGRGYHAGAGGLRIARLLRGRGCRLVAAPESFLVSSQNALLPGEAARARSWGALVGETTLAARVPGQP